MCGDTGWGPPACWLPALAWPRVQTRIRRVRRLYNRGPRWGELPFQLQALGRHCLTEAKPIVRSRPQAGAGSRDRKLRSSVALPLPAYSLLGALFFSSRRWQRRLGTSLRWASPKLYDAAEGFGQQTCSKDPPMPAWLGGKGTKDRRP